MKFSCDATILKKGISIAEKAITGKISTPIMSGIYLIAKGEILVLRGSDLNMSIETKVPVKVIEPGELLINAHLISELMGKLNGEITLYEEGQEIFIKSGDNNIYNTPKMNANDYPSFPELNTTQKIEISDNDFCRLVFMSEFSCGNDESRPLFTGVLVEIKEGKITFVGTNTHRLSIQSLDINCEDVTCVVPSKILNEVRNVALSYAEPQGIVVEILYNQIMFSVGETKFVTKLLDGRFPDYRKVVPKIFTLSAKVKSDELKQILDRVVIFSKSNDHSTVRLNFSNNKLEIVASGADIGMAKEELPCEIDGNDLKISFNASYIMDILKHTDAEFITFKLNTSLSPCIVDIGDPTFTYIVTPVRVL